MNVNDGTKSIAPLAGLRVLDFSRMLSGPMASMVLADMGAHVIRVEDLEGSDVTRHNPPYVNGESHYFISLNRNKESLAIDLKHPEGLAIALRLAEQSDVIIENFRPGVSERLGLGYEALRKLNPSIVYCSVSGFGQTGPLKYKTAYDLIIQAVTGAMAVTGEAGRPPTKMGLPLADELSAMFAAINILAAIDRRDRTGQGSLLDVSMFDVGVSLLGYMGTVYFATGEQAARLGSSHQTIYPYNAFPTKDGYIVVAAFTQAFWRKFAGAIERPDLPDDPRFSSFATRHAGRAELGAILEPILRQRTSAQWLAVLDAHDVPNGPVNTLAQAIEMAQTKARGMVVEVDHPTAGRMRTLGTPFHFEFENQASFVPTYQAAPVVGQHTQSILRDLLGYDEARIAALAADKAIGISTVPGATRGKPRAAALPATAAAAELPATPALAGKPLDGLRVLDLTRMFAGPFGTLILADLGAEIIKIEEPRIGDPTRKNIPFVNGESTYFMALNRGKKSMAMDLKTAGGREAFLDLVATADVVLENYRPGVMDRLGLSYAQLRARNPHIVLCSISGFGQTGPLRDKISFDLVNQAMAGTMAITGEEGRPPVRIGLPAGDLNGGIFASLAILAALYGRRRVGLGAHIDLGLHDLLVALLGYMAQLYFTTGESAGPVGSGHHHIAPYRAFEASDGDLVIAAFSQAFWVKFASAIGRPELTKDPRYRVIDDRKIHKDELQSMLEPLIRSKTVAEWLAIFDANDVPSAAIASIGDVLGSAQAQARELVVDFVHPKAGPLRALGTPCRADGAVLRSPYPPPMLGEHTDQILKDLLGYSEERIAALRAAKSLDSP